MNDKQKTMGSGDCGMGNADCGLNDWGENNDK